MICFTNPLFSCVSPVLYILFSSVILSGGWRHQPINTGIIFPFQITNNKNIPTHKTLYKMGRHLWMPLCSTSFYELSKFFTMRWVARRIQENDPLFRCGRLVWIFWNPLLTFRFEVKFSDLLVQRSKDSRLRLHLYILSCSL